jgi:hypothetical protein
MIGLDVIDADGSATRATGAFWLPAPAAVAMAVLAIFRAFRSCLLRSAMLGSALTCTAAELHCLLPQATWRPALYVPARTCLCCALVLPLQTLFYRHALRYYGWLGPGWYGLSVRGERCFFFSGADYSSGVLLWFTLRLVGLGLGLGAVSGSLRLVYIIPRHGLLLPRHRYRVCRTAPLPDAARLLLLDALPSACYSLPFFTRLPALLRLRRFMVSPYHHPACPHCCHTALRRLNAVGRAGLVCAHALPFSGLCSW